MHSHWFSHVTETNSTPTAQAVGRTGYACTYHSLQMSLHTCIIQISCEPFPMLNNVRSLH